jgi:hypothetical protein
MENHRHAVMKVSEQLIRSSRHDRAGFHDLPFLRSPAIPNTRESKERVILHAKVELLLRVAGSSPLIETVGRESGSGFTQGSLFGNPQTIVGVWEQR